MKIGILGTGMVGETLASKLVQLGHEVCMGARSATNEKAAAWVRGAGAGASAGTFADAAASGEVIFNCTKGEASLDAVRAAGEPNLRGKILVDVSNPLDFSKGMPPTLFVSGHDSLGEQIQRAIPTARVVKTLNTINCAVMVDPGRIRGDHDVFLSGNDREAKAKVAELLAGFGWKRSQIVDLGDLPSARGTEAYVLFWLRVWGAYGTPDINIKIAR